MKQLILFAFIIAAVTLASGCATWSGIAESGLMGAGCRLRHMERHRGKRPYGRRVAVEMKINPVSAILQAITHWRDQRQRRKREKAVRTAEAQLTAARERLAEHEAWLNAFNKRSDRLVGGITHDELVDILREQSDQS